jgi:hypothetical protein
MGLIFVTAGERSVACGSAKTQNLPEWAKPFCVFVLPIRAVDACTLHCPQATLRSPCGYENLAFQAAALLFQKGKHRFGKRYRRF